MNIYLKRSPSGLVASDEIGAAEIAKIKVGEVVRASVVRPRNPRSAQQNRLYWKLCQVVLDNTEGRFASREQVSDYLKIQAGHCDQTYIKVPNDDGDFDTLLWLQPRSIAFDKMGHEEFQEYWRKALEIISTRILPMSADELEREINEMLGVAA